MVNYLSEYIVNEHELSNVRTDIKLKIDELMAGENRLHCFMQLYEIARTTVEALEATDKSGFLTLLSRDLENVRTNLDVQLTEKSRDVKNEFEKLQEDAQEAEKELQVRGACIESVLKGMGKTEEFHSKLQEIREQMSGVEQKIVELQNIRQSSPFIEMCKLVNNES